MIAVDAVVVTYGKYIPKIPLLKAEIPNDKSAKKLRTWKVSVAKKGLSRNPKTWCIAMRHPIRSPAIEIGDARPR
jgi:hypothetical protein